MPTELIENYLDETQVERLRKFCSTQLSQVPISPIGRSKIVRYGWDYDDPSKWLCKIPFEFFWIQNGAGFDAITLNEYVSGRTIEAHIDSVKFADEIRIISIGATGIFCLHKKPVEKFELKNGSMFRFWGDERQNIKHSTLPAKGLRYSIVFRKKL